MREAAQSGGILVLPKTVILENERHQESLYNETIAKLHEARLTLERWGLTVPAFRSEQVVGKTNIVTVLQETGIAVEVEDPTLDDYRDAERRACLHLPPQPPDPKTDEMRDLVIWAVALRVAKRDGNAILVSRDVVHSHDRGADEARASGLLQAKTFDEALELLGRMSKASVLARSVLAKVWSPIGEAGVPLPEEIPARRFSRLQFRVDDMGYIEMRSSFEFTVSDRRIAGDVHVFQSAPEKISVELESVCVNGTPWAQGRLIINADGELPKSASAASERLQELQGVIEGSI